MPRTSTSFQPISAKFAIINFCLCLYLELFIQHWRQQTYEHLHASDNIGLRAEDSHYMTEVVVWPNQKQTTISDTLLLQHSVFWHTCNIEEVRDWQGGWYTTVAKQKLHTACLKLLLNVNLIDQSIQLTQCCTQFKLFGNKMFCFRNFPII